MSSLRQHLLFYFLIIIVVLTLSQCFIVFAKAQQSVNSLSCQRFNAEPTLITLNAVGDFVSFETSGTQRDLQLHETDDDGLDMVNLDAAINDSSLYCSYVITASKSYHRLSLNIANFLTPSDVDNNCDEAFVRIYDSDSPNFPRRNKTLELCPPTSIRPPLAANLTSTNNAIIVEIYAKSPQNIAIFVASVVNIGRSLVNGIISEQLDEVLIMPPDKDNLIADRSGMMTTDEAELNSGCLSRRSQSGMTGSFSSLFYPCPYGPRLHCVWDIHVPPGMLILIGFNRIFFIEAGSKKKCANDHLSFYKSAPDNDTFVLVRRFCGKGKPPSMYLHSNRIRVVFHSDDLVEGYGFRLHWAAVSRRDIENIGISAARARFPTGSPKPRLTYASHTDIEACAPGFRGVVLAARSGYLASPNFDNGNYTPNIKCSWIISGNVQQFIILYPLDFKVEQSVNCSFDHVEVFDGTQHLGRFCSTMFIPPFVSKTNKVVVNFISDSYVEDQGFKMFYRLVTGSELLTMMASGGFYGRVPSMATVTTTVASIRSETLLEERKTALVAPLVQPQRVIAVPPQKAVICGDVSKGNFGASFGNGCHGALISEKWLLSTTNCLSSQVDGNTTMLSYYGGNAVINWATGQRASFIEHIVVKPATSLPVVVAKSTPLVGLALVRLSEPAVTLEPVCLPASTEDDETTDPSCLFPSTSSKQSSQTFLQLPNQKCSQIVRQAGLNQSSGLTVPADQLHFFECFLIGVEDPATQNADDSSTITNFCRSGDVDELGQSYFNQFPLGFCRSYDDSWAITDILVAVLTSRGCGGGFDVAAVPTLENRLITASVIPATPPQTVAIFLRVSHFTNWFVSIMGNHST